MGAALAALTLAVTACGDRPDDASDARDEPSESQSATTPAESNPDHKACMVSDSGGFDDKSFNQTSYKGLTDAQESLGVETAEIESQSDSDYVDNIAALLNQDCKTIVTVGFKLGDATLAAAKKNKNVDFAIVDYVYTEVTPPENLRGLAFDTAQSSFLAGYLAAGMSESGTVATFGGLNIPTVTIFMEGYAEGVAHYNEVNGTDVQVLGWDPQAKDGVFTNDFENKTTGQNTAQSLIAQGADVIFPVAGPAGLGGLQAAQDSGGTVNAIWVDTDGCVSAPEYCSVIMSSVEKGMDVAVADAIADSVHGEFSNETYVGTLENGGTDLAEYHEFEEKIPQELKDQIDQLRQDIIDGTVTVESSTQ
jgi:basic membrane protein A